MDRKAFLTEKANNFCTFIKTLKPDSTVLSMIDDFKPENLDYSLTKLKAYSYLSGVTDIVKMILEHCDIEKSKLEDCKEKITRYVEMFLSV